MDLRRISYFLAVCRHNSFSRAADECGVSQPALTKAIKALEAEVGGELLHREGRRLVLSELGQMLLPYLQRLAGEQDAVLTVARNYKLLAQAPLRIGILPTIGPLRIGRFLRVFRDEHPGIELAVSEGSVGQLTEQLEQAAIDVAIANLTGRIDDRFRQQLLYREPYLVIFPPGHRFAQLETVRLADLDGEDYVDRLACEMREMVMQVVGERSIRLYARYRSEREDWVQTMVAAGLGFAFLPEYSVTMAGTQSRMLTEPSVARDVHAVEVRGRPRTAAASLFLQELAGFNWTVQ
ncbi:LysR family transcriptional regulator [Piscinibacter sakaiensis]|uniref:LysR family transcriptional regulator n=1 Tax=Piscinibacter sakaiensis TaxID=1547922 RepID=UPI003AAEC64A